MRATAVSRSYDELDRRDVSDLHRAEQLFVLHFRFAEVFGCEFSLDARHLVRETAISLEQAGTRHRQGETKRRLDRVEDQSGAMLRGRSAIV